MSTDKAQKERRAADLRLSRVYGHSLAEIEKRHEKQGGVCAICQRPPVRYRLNVDHAHAFDKIKILASRIGKWGEFAWRAITATPAPDGCVYSAIGPDRQSVKDKVRRALRRRSVRGLLCMRCNKGLQYFRDSVESLERAAGYLRTFNEGLMRLRTLDEGLNA